MTPQEATQARDARLVAVCHADGISHILTVNTGNFLRYRSIGPGITIVNPSEI
jgi:hypothetical protein